MRKNHLHVLTYILLIAIMGIAAYTLGIWRPSTSHCMGVELASASKIDRITVSRQQSDALDVPILLDGTPLATDHQSQTVYIPQAIQEDTTRDDLIGTISVEPPYSLSFLKEDAFAYLSGAASNNHAFTLLVYDDDVYARYKVVFTTLPVLTVTSADSHTEDDQTEVFTGSFTAFSANEGDVPIQTAFAEWHVRGNNSTMMDKKAWRLSLKDEGGDKQNLTLAGLGSDDDWLLNPMARDDLKIREHFIANLWNQITDDESLSMSEGEYVELVMDGKYMGLYLLQRRVDRKYLSLNDNAILMKGKNVTESHSAEDALEIIHSAIDEQDAYAIAEPFYANCAPATIDLAAYVRYELLINLCYLPDNIKLKNTFYLWQRSGDGYTLSFIPWDTDLSLGLDYKNGIMFNIYLAEEAEILHRQEYEALDALYPDLDRRIALGWQELRQSLISYEGLAEQITALRTDLKQSGALLRDSEVWGNYALGADTEYLLFSFLRSRIEQLDAYYGSMLE